MRVTNRRRWMRTRIQLAIGIAATFVAWADAHKDDEPNFIVFGLFVAALFTIVNSITNDLN